ncbi:hypothetical protein J528_4598, partial [Acinetobacter baumannii 135867]
MNSKVNIGKTYSVLKSEFIHTLKSIDQSKNIYEIFHDFVFCSAAALRNSIGHR